MENQTEKISLEDFIEGQGNDFSLYHLQTSRDSDVDIDKHDTDFDSFYNVNDNVYALSDLDEKLLQFRQSNIL